jgi:hypothetical protein
VLKAANDLLELRAYSNHAYEGYALTSLTACSVFLLQEWGLLTSFENIAVLNHRLFPRKFAMVGWPQFPDANRTNRSILQMRPKWRNLATSVTGKGVFLNEQGIMEAKSILFKLGPPKLGGASAVETLPVIKAERGEKPRTIHAEDLVKKLKGSRLFRLYTESKWHDAEAIDLLGLLGVYDHTASKEKRRRLNEFKIHAKELGDAEALDFIKAIENSFRAYLSK